ncbi:MAG: hypothetical protein L0Z62_40480, partial [Gemmataceae bacterium]|nr:hypothetical protein [Gemmataceae bacterium]
MRRRRQGLQVSTFPFLAVLLCAMGSLILLLLVIDRRAKVVAQVKAQQAAAKAVAENEKAAAARREELERRRQALHAALAEQDQQVRTQINAVQERTESTLKSVQTEEARVRALQEQVQVERDRLTQGEEEIVARRVEAERLTQQAKGSQAELARLTADLQRMEQTLVDLKAARQRQPQRYSVVPYRGRRGDNRRPLYVECTAHGLVFHPDRLTLPSLTVTAQDVRAEIERRIERQRAAGAGVPGKPGEKAYLLMLVRPDGIVTYYHTQAFLKGLPLDFGYEFIDAEWILDFPEEENAPTSQPWMTAGKTDRPGTVPMPVAPPRRPPPTGLPGIVSGGDTDKQANGSSDGRGQPPLRSRLLGNATGSETTGGRPPVLAAPLPQPPAALTDRSGPATQPSPPFPGDPPRLSGGPGSRGAVGLPQAGAGPGLQSPSGSAVPSLGI